jgi:tetratricopeptide (TPR) repeat protein
VVSVGYKFGKAGDLEQKGAKEYYESSIKKILLGDYKGALGDLEDACYLDGKNKDYSDMREIVKKVEVYVPNAVGDDKYTQAVRNGVLKYVNEGDVKQAINLLMYAYSLKQDNEKVEKLAKALAKEYKVEVPENAKTWNLAEQKLYQALEKFKEKKYDETIKLCEEVLVLDPNSVVAYKRLGSTFYILGNNEKAKKNWQKVIELAPKDKEVPDIKKLLRELEAKKVTIGD